ncbi:MAG: tetratricopeptide repeat protein [Candidatus Eisenbacteria bacterium]
MGRARERASRADRRRTHGRRRGQDLPTFAAVALSLSGRLRPWFSAAALTFLIVGSGRAQTAVAPDWNALRRSVVDLEVFMPGATEPIHCVGFALQDLPGIVSSYRLAQGAQRVVIRPSEGEATETSRFLAADPAADLILLDGRVTAAGLVPGPIDLFNHGQVALVYLPPASRDPILSLPVFGQFAGPDMMTLHALPPGGPSGAPLADSLGRAVGMVESIRDGELAVGLAIPIERVQSLGSSAQTGGRLLDLTSRPAAAWTRAGTPEGSQVIGAVLGRGRKLDDAVPYLERALAGQPGMPAGMLELGTVRQAQGRLDEAEAVYRRALELHPQLPAVYLSLGACLHAGGLYLQSQQIYEEGLRLAPHEARLHMNLGGIFFLQDKRPEAEVELREALRLNPNLGIAHYNLGALLKAQGRPGEALEVWKYLREQRSGYAGQLAKTAGLATPADTR